MKESDKYEYDPIKKQLQQRLSLYYTPQVLWTEPEKEDKSEWEQKIFEEQKRRNHARLDEMISRLERELAEEAE
jgi:hypothetical protein